MKTKKIIALFLFLTASLLASAQSSGGWLLHHYEYQRAVKELEQENAKSQQRNTPKQGVYNSPGHFNGSGTQQRVNYQNQVNGTQVYNSPGQFVPETPEQAERVRRWNEAINQGAADAINQSMSEYHRSGNNYKRKSTTINKKRFNSSINAEVRTYKASKRSSATTSDHRNYNYWKNNNQKKYGSQCGR